MARVLVTGMSGTGKSSVLEALSQRGHDVVDTDVGEWITREAHPDGSTERVWREEPMRRLLEAHRAGHLFVAGCVMNQGSFYTSL